MNTFPRKNSFALYHMYSYCLCLPDIKFYESSKIKEVAEKFKQALLAYPVRRYAFQIERGENTNMIHIQGCFETRGRQNFLKLHSFFQERMGPRPANIELARNANHLLMYCMKDRSRVWGPYFYNVGAPDLSINPNPNSDIQLIFDQDI